MITIFYGDNIAASRKAYTSLREKEQEPIQFDGSKMTLTDFIQATQTQDLFDASTKTIFIEEFFSKRKASKEMDALIEAIIKAGNENTIIIWESKELTPKQAKTFTKATIQKFDFPKNLFAFLDSLKPGNSKQALLLFQECLHTEEPELLFFMMIRQIRMMLALSDGQDDNVIDEIKRMQSWQLPKLQKQAQVFGQESLLALYDKLYTIEYGQKTGRLATNLIEAIDFLLASL